MCFVVGNTSGECFPVGNLSVEEYCADIISQLDGEEIATTQDACHVHVDVVGKSILYVAPNPGDLHVSAFTRVDIGLHKENQFIVIASGLHEDPLHKRILSTYNLSTKSPFSI